MTKIKLGLLYGGKSAEHQVSLQTALAAIKALNQDKFEIHPIYITEQGQWVRGERIEGEVTDVEASKNEWCRKCDFSVIIKHRNHSICSF